ncbi:D-alanyl-D-alanine carboxypeptidase family protein [Roseibium salinum]|nr:D-alanyl-D-alanine carboxypeptidase family protein [Roseibium salinum]
MMTAYVTFKAIREGRASFKSAVVQSQNSISEPPSKMGFKVGTRFTVDAALKIILVKSANDVAVALGEAIAGSEAGFIAMMNAEARRLGMTNTSFTNPHGLPDNGQVTTARDMAILAMALRQDFPESEAYYNHPGIRLGKKTLRSANREFLLRVPGANGMKTGYICNSGYNVAASVTRRGRTLIAVVLGAGSGLERTAFARELFDEGFRKGGGGRKNHQPFRLIRQSARQRVLQAQQQSGREGLHGPVRYGKTKSRGGFLFFAGGGDKNDDDIDESGFTLSNGKPDWAKILDRTLGPRRVAYRPLEVSLGNPTASPAANGSAPALEVAIPAGAVPTPVANPLRLAEIEIRAKLQESAATDAVGAGSQGTAVPAAAADLSTMSPGSIFRQGMDFSVPVPPPSPRK